MAVAGRGKRIPSNVDPASATASCLENILQVASFSDDVVIIEEHEYEHGGHGQYNRFVKLKKSHWADPKQRRLCRSCMVDFAPKAKKFNCRR